MPKWIKGNPKPENWPEWLKKANIACCDVDIDSSGYVTWKEGVWENGAWHSGTWRSGVWHNGTWVDGTWESGDWESGTWCNGNWDSGNWDSGTWRNGFWLNGTWHRGTWLEGTWYGGTWVTGTWHNGIWVDGTWVDGTWEAGHQRKPRFAWSLDSNGLIRGFDGELWDSKTAEEWRETLQGKDPLKLAELESLVLWVAAFKRSLAPASTNGPNIWDHLNEIT